MKGLIFTEFIEMVESKFGFETSQGIIDDSGAPTKGAYTAVGNYSTNELMSLIDHLSQRTKIPIPELMISFGEYFFVSLSNSYSMFFPEGQKIIPFLASLHDYIHVEVKKLYPESIPPSLLIKHQNENSIDLLYESHRAMGDFATGLLRGAMKHFEVEGTINSKKLDDNGNKILFSIVITD